MRRTQNKFANTGEWKTPTFMLRFLRQWKAPFRIHGIEKKFHDVRIPAVGGDSVRKKAASTARPWVGGGMREGGDDEIIMAPESRGM